MSGNKKQTVLFLNHWARRLGGAEHSLLDILFFAQDKFNCHLASSEHGPLIDKASRLDIQCHVVFCSPSVEKLRRWNLLSTLFFSWHGIIAFLSYIYRLRKLVKQIKPKLIHANVPKSHIALYLLARIGFNGNCCFHIREIFKKRSTAAFLYRLFFSSKNSTVIVISKSVKHSLPVCIRTDTRVIYNGVAVSPFYKKYVYGSVLKLLYLGRIVPWKGCHLLIDILSMIRKRYPSEQIELSLVGDTMYWSSDYRSALKNKIEDLHLSPYCHLLPYSDDPVSIFTAHDIFCNASFQEPFGRVIAEAQGCGLPVVAFNSGGIPEIVEHDVSGILVPYKDMTCFTEAISRFITSPDLIKKMGTKGRERVEHYFNRNRQGPIICNFLDEQIAS